VKWIVSSRNWPEIEERLDAATGRVRLYLELNEKSISAAVSIYIRHKVDRLAVQKKYDKKTRDTVQHYLSLNANDTFLWVALVCQELAKTPRPYTLSKLKAFPSGLDDLYQRMMDQICSSDTAELCKQILAVVSIVRRPITLWELTSFVSLPEGVSSNDHESLAEIVGLCGSFLTLRERAVYFVHQSAQEFLLEKAYDKIFPSRKEDIHRTIFLRSLKIMSKVLQRDVYRLVSPGFSINQVEQPNPDPLAAARYSCIHWVDHLSEWNSLGKQEDLQDSGVIDTFLRKNYLYWLEALSLLKSISEGVLSMAKLEDLLQVSFIHSYNRKGLS
jgi:hypothetical protein